MPTILYEVPSWEHADRLEAGRDVTDVVLTEDGYPRAGVALVSFDGDSLHGLGLLTRGQVVATATRRVRLSEFTLIDAIPLDEVRNALPNRLRQHVGFGLLPPRTGDEVVSALGRLRPALQDDLERLASLAERPPSATLTGVRDVLALEKDAVGLALSISGLDRRPLTEWATGAHLDSFIEGLPEYPIAEDAAIVHDLLNFPGWELVAEGATGVAEFSDGRRQVTVINVNRGPIEARLGVDLVYIHRDLDAFILVQYKRFREEGRTPRQLVFRPSGDGSIEKELERMRLVPTAPISAGVPDSYRLHPGSCFLKLCHPTSPLLTSPDLVKGMYIPLDYWDCLAASPDVRGRRGGVAFGYHSITRYLSNSLFIALAQRAWIGSRGTASRELARVVDQGLRVGRSVVVGISDSG